MDLNFKVLCDRPTKTKPTVPPEITDRVFRTVWEMLNTRGLNVNPYALVIALAKARYNCLAPWQKLVFIMMPASLLSLGSVILFPGMIFTAMISCFLTIGLLNLIYPIGEKAFVTMTVFTSNDSDLAEIDLLAKETFIKISSILISEGCFTYNRDETIFIYCNLGTLKSELVRILDKSKKRCSFIEKLLLIFAKPESLKRVRLDDHDIKAMRF